MMAGSDARPGFDGSWETLIGRIESSLSGMTQEGLDEQAEHVRTSAKISQARTLDELVDHFDDDDHWNLGRPDGGPVSGGDES